MVAYVCLFSVIATFMFVFLYIMISQASLHLSSRLKSCNMWPTLDVFRCLLMANRPALRWAISSCSISSLFHLHVLTCTFDSIVVCTFSFGHCIVRLSSIYDFWLPLWYLQTLLIMPLYPFWCSFRTTNISIFWLVQFYICIILYVYLTLLFNHSQSFWSDD